MAGSTKALCNHPGVNHAEAWDFHRSAVQLDATKFYRAADSDISNSSNRSNKTVTRATTGATAAAATAVGRTRAEASNNKIKCIK